MHIRSVRTRFSQVYAAYHMGSAVADKSIKPLAEVLTTGSMSISEHVPRLVPGRGFDLAQASDREEPFSCSVPEAKLC